MDRGNSNFRGYLYSDVPEEKAIIAEGLEALDAVERSQIPEAESRYAHLHLSATRDYWPGVYVSSTGDPVPVRQSKHQFLRVAPAELPLAIAAAEKMQKSRRRSKRRVAKEIATILRDELEAFKSTNK